MRQSTDGGNADTDGGTADAGTTLESTLAELSTIGCVNDFNTFAALPLDVTLSGVSSMPFSSN